MGDLSGKVAIVTGAARKRGIGRAIALRLAEDGADVVVSGFPRDPSSYPQHEQDEGWRGVATVAAEVEERGRRALAIECDVTIKADVEAMVARTVAELGSVDILVNNAALPSEAGQAPRSGCGRCDRVHFRIPPVDRCSLRQSRCRSKAARGLGGQRGRKVLPVRRAGG